MTRTRVLAGSHGLGAMAVLMGQLLSGCSGGGGAGMDGPGGDGPPGAVPGTGGNGSVPGDGDLGGDGDGDVAGPAVDAPSAAWVRRLTHVEYDNTIADLLDVHDSPSSNFENDLAQDGFTNNAAAQNVSPTLVEQYTLASEAISEAATQDLPGLLGCDPAFGNEQTCVESFIGSFGRKVWRRPLSAEEETRMFGFFSTVRGEFELEESVQMVLQVFLQSPQFIYMLEPIPEGAVAGSVAPLSGWEVATRLSFFLLGSTPDDELLDAAAAGELDTADGVAAQARRLLDLPRARERIGLFYTEWLRLRNIERMQKDQNMFPGYDLTMGPVMLEQVKRFTQAIILDDEGTATDLLTAPFTFMSPELAPLYGETMPTTPMGQFERMDLDGTQRAGLLTHVAVLSSLAHSNQTDPVHRGKFVRNGLLCEDIDPPPPDLVINVPEVEPGATTRERFNIHQEQPACRTCHIYMDPIGLGFENYDALGQWRETDAGQPVDATGEIVGSDVAGPFDGAVQLAQKLAESDQVMDCMTRTWLRFALGRSDNDADAGAVEVAGGKFEESGFVMKELLVAVTQTDTFRSGRVLDPNTSSLQQEKP